ncbi:hypothetical protein RUND412_011210 [Rhizina undulata]
MSLNFLSEDGVYTMNQSPVTSCPLWVSTRNLLDNITRVVKKEDVTEETIGSSLVKTHKPEILHNLERRSPGYYFKVLGHLSLNLETNFDDSKKFC